MGGHQSRTIKELDQSEQILRLSNTYNIDKSNIIMKEKFDNKYNINIYIITSIIILFILLYIIKKK